MQSRNSNNNVLQVIIYKVLMLWPCHRIKARSPNICGIDLPVCYRCLGIIIGLPIGYIIQMKFNIDSKWIGAIFIIPLLIDVMMQHNLNIMSNNTRRFITGICFGIGSSIYLIVWCTYNFI